jgi:hypothetical protein
MFKSALPRRDVEWRCGDDAQCFNLRSRARSGAKEPSVCTLVKEFQSCQRNRKVQLVVAVRADAQIATVGMAAGPGERRDLGAFGRLILRATFPYPVA